MGGGATCRSLESIFRCTRSAITLSRSSSLVSFTRQATLLPAHGKHPTPYSTYHPLLLTQFLFSERISIHSTGLVVYLLFPGAFVTLDANALARLAPLRRLRVVSAGCWHNAVLAVCSYVALATMPMWLAVVGYRNLVGVTGGGGGMMSMMRRSGEGGVVVLDIVEVKIKTEKVKTRLYNNLFFLFLFLVILGITVIRPSPTRFNHHIHQRSCHRNRRQRMGG